MATMKEGVALSTEREVEEWLLALIEEEITEEPRLVPIDPPAKACRFRDIGLLAVGRGIVVTCGDCEFQISIVQSRGADVDEQD